MKIQMGVKPEGYDKPLRNIIESLVSQIEENRHLLKCGETSDFGNVFAASGFRRSSEDGHLDWALIVPTRPVNTDVSPR